MTNRVAFLARGYSPSGTVFQTTFRAICFVVNRIIEDIYSINDKESPDKSAHIAMLDHFKPLWIYYFPFACKQEQTSVFYSSPQMIGFGWQDKVYNPIYFKFIDDCLSSVDGRLLNTIRAPPDETSSKYQHLLGPRWPTIIEDLHTMYVDDAFKICKKYYRLPKVINSSDKPYYVEGVVFLKVENKRVTNYWDSNTFWASLPSSVAVSTDTPSNAVASDN
jgi:hypothetical protein